MSNKSEIGKAIVTIRKSKKMTQESLAEAASVSTSYLRDIEHGDANPSISILVNIADALKVSLPALISSSAPEERRGTE